MCRLKDRRGRRPYDDEYVPSEPPPMCRGLVFEARGDRDGAYFSLTAFGGMALEVKAFGLADWPLFEGAAETVRIKVDDPRALRSLSSCLEEVAKSLEKRLKEVEG